jgi:D-threonate/D-erythronate kinase
MRAIADDLTGALELGACFATDAVPVEILWHGSSTAANIVFDTETREALQSVAFLRIAETAWVWSGELSITNDLYLKKIDSLLRGNTAAEIAYCIKQQEFRSVIIAPALPAEQRITRLGKQFQRIEGSWVEIQPEFYSQLVKFGISVALKAAGEIVTGEGVFLCDAESDDDLGALVRNRHDLVSPVLWCGTAALAGALAGKMGHLQFVPQCAALLIIVGSDTNLAAKQVERLAPSMVGVVGSPEEIEGVVSKVSQRLRENLPACIYYRLGNSERGAARKFIEASILRLVSECPRPGALLTVGGSTTFDFCNAVKAHALRTFGTVCTGVPQSTIDGGQYSGIPLFTKSGSFGNQNTLVDLIASISRKCED